MVQRNEYLICYDIKDNKVRKQVFNHLVGYGLLPVQKSVFWGFLLKSERAAIQTLLGESLDLKRFPPDKVLITRSSFANSHHYFTLGHAKHEFQDWEDSDVI